MTTAHITQTTVETLTDGSPQALVTHAIAEVLSDTIPHACVTHLILEVLAPVGSGGTSSGGGQPVVYIIT